MKTLAIIAVITLAFGSALTANYCGVAHCASCAYFPVLMEDRSCINCVRGVRVLVSSSSLATKCDNEGLPANCASFEGSRESMTATKKCGECKEGFNMIEASKTCAEQTTKIENAYSYYEGKLSACKKGYYRDDQVCVKATEIKECAGIYFKNGSTIRCGKCNKGFVPNEADGRISCIADAKNGCASTATPCTLCNFEYGYYAVEYDLTTGNKCEYSARTLALGAILAFVFALLN